MTVYSPLGIFRPSFNVLVESLRIGNYTSFSNYHLARILVKFTLSYTSFDYNSHALNYRRADLQLMYYLYATVFKYNASDQTGRKNNLICLYILLNFFKWRSSHYIFHVHCCKLFHLFIPTLVHVIVDS